jgi:hypothetical protein
MNGILGKCRAKNLDRSIGALPLVVKQKEGLHMSRRMHNHGWRVVMVLLLLAIAAACTCVEARVGPNKATQKDAHDDGTIVDWPDTVVPSHADAVVGVHESPMVAYSASEEFAAAMMTLRVS